MVGRWLIGLAVRLIGGALERGKKLDATLTQYLKSIISVLLTLVLILAILDIFGIKTTSFAALLAGAGLAIGTAWSGMLGNFAAGLFLQVLRPYTHNDHYWQVYFDTHKAVVATFGAAGYPVPETPVAHRTV